MSEMPVLGVIGGTGFYTMPDLEDVEEYALTTPFGEPSAPLLVGRLEGRRIAFLARYGLGHRLLPGEINYRANIYALKSLGVQRVVGVCACGSLREDFAPGDVIIPDQLIDMTKKRQDSFFGNGLVANLSVAEPFCEGLAQALFQCSTMEGANAHKGGSLLTIEGPRFSTRGETNVFRLWGIAVLCMTASPEAYLAREAEMCYTVLGHVTDYDVWHIQEEAVNVRMIQTILSRNIATVQRIIRHLVATVDESIDCACQHALANAIMTHRDAIPTEVREKLQLLIGKYL